MASPALKSNMAPQNIRGKVRNEIIPNFSIVYRIFFENHRTGEIMRM